MLPAWLGRAVGALASSTQTPASLSALFALSVVSACVQRRYAVSPLGDPDYIEPASFWSLVSAASGSRKTAIVSFLTKPLFDWERRAKDAMGREIARVKSQRIVAEAVIKRLQGEAAKTADSGERERLRAAIEAEQVSMPEELFSPQVCSGEVTVERLQQIMVEQGGRAAVLSDEAGLFSTISGTYGGGAGPSLDALLQGHAGGEVRVDRATRTAHVSRAAVVLGLAIQPDLLQEAAGSNRFRASGLLARFAFALPRQFVGGRDVRRYSPVPDDVRREYAREIDALLGDPREGSHKPPVILQLTDEARELWLDYCQEIEHALAPEGELYALSDWGAKAGGMTARLALLFELVTSGPGAELVCGDTMSRAIALARLLTPHAKAAFRLLASDEADRDGVVIVEWIRRSGPLAGFRQSDCHRALHGRFTRRERLVAALQRLQANGVLRHESKKNDAARATDWWNVNPRLFHH